MKYPVPTFLTPFLTPFLTLSVAVCSVLFAVPSHAETKVELGNSVNNLANPASLQSIAHQENGLPLNHQSNLDQNQSLTLSETLVLSKTTDNLLAPNSSDSKNSEEEKTRNPISSRIFACPSMSQ